MSIAAVDAGIANNLHGDGPESNGPALGFARSVLDRLGVEGVIAAVVLVLFFVAVIAPELITSVNPEKVNYAITLKGPTLAHPFGTDALGRDIFSRVVWGAHNSLDAAVGVVLVGCIVGLLIGAAAGWRGGRFDRIIMHVVDLFLAFPAFILAIVVASSLGRNMLSVAIALAAVWWPSYARLVRNEVISLRHREYVLAARALGVRRTDIVSRHVVRFLWRDLCVRITTDVGYALLSVTALSFLGLGAQEPTPEWGLMVSGSISYFNVAWWYMTFPGLAITLVAVACSLLGDRLSEHV